MQEQKIINKTYSFANKENASSEDTNQEVDAVIEAVNKKLYRSKSTVVKKVLLLVVFFSFILAVGYWFLLWDREPRYLRVGESNQTNTYADFQLELKPRYEIQTSDIDLSEVDAEAVIAFNPVNYQVFTEVNSDKQMSIASITKLITAGISLELYSDDTPLIYKETPEEPLPGSIGLEEGDSMKLDDALNALLVGSRNDVALLLAQNHPDGYEGFVNEMNSKAQELGMYKSSFSNPAGFDSVNNYSTANDLKKLALYSIRNEEVVKRTSQIKTEVVITNAQGEERIEEIDTTNYLLGSSRYVKGLKTGSTQNAGKCFIGYFYASKDDQLITIILNSKEDRFEETEELIKIVNDAFTPDSTEAI